MDADSRTKRVLFLTHALNLGGVSTHMQALGRQLMAIGVHVGIVARSLDHGKPFGFEYFNRAGFQIYQCAFPGYGLSPANIVKAARSVIHLRRVCREFGADIVHVHAPTLCLVARLLRRPYVTTFNISVSGQRKRRIAKLVNYMDGGAFGRFSFAISEELRENLVSEIGIPERRVRKVRYTIDDTAYRPASPVERSLARSLYGVPDDAVTVCMVASLEPRKNHGLLLDALVELRDRDRPVCVLLAGSGWGDQEDVLREAIRSRNLGATVKYLGQQPATTVYHASDIFVLPSRQEGFPLSVVEAMLSGLVAIRTPSEGAREQISDGETGFVVPFDEPSVLADRLECLLLDEPLRNAMKAAAARTARERFSSRLMAEEMLSLYNEALLD